MSPDNPFLKALLADPDDDTLRLAMADWLDENGQPGRGEFIRVQCELARGVADLDRRRLLEVRQRDLLVAHDREWVEPLARLLGCTPGEWGGWVFRRGFVEYFRLPAPRAIQQGAKLAALTPVRELYLTPATSAQLVVLLKRVWLDNLTALYLPNTRLSPSAVRAFLNCRHLGKLRVLRHNGVERDDEAAAAFRERFAHALRSPR